MRSTTRRAFMGATRTPRAMARATCVSSPSWEVISCLSLRPGSAAPRPAVVLDVTPEGPGRGELAELVPDHGLGHEDRDVLATVVHGDGVAEHVRDDRRAAGPGPDDGLGALLVLDVHLLEQVVVDERALLQAAWHRASDSSALLAGAPAADDQGIAGLALARPALGL